MPSEPGDSGSLSGCGKQPPSGRLVAQKVAVMLQVGSPWIVLAATTVLAMILAGLAGGTGHLFRESLRGPRGSVFNGRVV